VAGALAKGKRMSSSDGAASKRGPHSAGITQTINTEAINAGKATGLARTPADGEEERSGDWYTINSKKNKNKSGTKDAANCGTCGTMKKRSSESLVKPAKWKASASEAPVPALNQEEEVMAGSIRSFLADYLRRAGPVRVDDEELKEQIDGLDADARDLVGRFSGGLTSFLTSGGGNEVTVVDDYACDSSDVDGARTLILKKLEDGVIALTTVNDHDKRSQQHMNQWTSRGGGARQQGGGRHFERRTSHLRDRQLNDRESDSGPPVVSLKKKTSPVSMRHYDAAWEEVADRPEPAWQRKGSGAAASPPVSMFPPPKAPLTAAPPPAIVPKPLAPPNGKTTVVVRTPTLSPEAAAAVIENLTSRLQEVARHNGDLLVQLSSRDEDVRRLTQMVVNLQGSGREQERLK